MNDNKLKIISIGGTETVTKNMTVYESGDDIIIVDCGVAFPDTDMLGVNVLIPDFTYVLENSHKIRGLFITHGHEDHIGAVPHILQDLPDLPIYASNLVQGFITEKMRDPHRKDQEPKVKFHLFDPSTGSVQAGCFRVEAFGVNHSVPHATGLAITTPAGLVLHMADYKIDFTPVIDKPIDLAKIVSYSEKGILCLLSDCLNVTQEGFTKSEKTLSETFMELMEEAEGRQLLITTISTNLSRMHQIISAAVKHGRKVCMVGRSIDQSVTVARKLGLLPFDESIFIKDSDAADYSQHDLVYIIAGCYGQYGSALGRVSRGEHKNISLEKDALVVFSADPNPPGVDMNVEDMMSKLTLAGAEVVYSKIQANLHVSGHGTRGDLTTVAALTKAKYYVPIGGTILKMREYTKMLKSIGIAEERSFEVREGEVLEFSDAGAKIIDKIEMRQVFIGSDAGNEINPVVIKDRGQLSSEGVFVVVIPTRDNKPLTDKIEVITRGFVYVKESQQLMDKSRKFSAKVVQKYAGRDQPWSDVKRKMENEIRAFLNKEAGGSPLVIVHTIGI